MGYFHCCIDRVLLSSSPHLLVPMCTRYNLVWVCGPFPWVCTYKGIAGRQCIWMLQVIKESQIAFQNDCSSFHFWSKVAETPLTHILSKTEKCHTSSMLPVKWIQKGSHCDLDFHFHMFIHHKYLLFCERPVHAFVHIYCIDFFVSEAFSMLAFCQLLLPLWFPSLQLVFHFLYGVLKGDKISWFEGHVIYQPLISWGFFRGRDL